MSVDEDAAERFRRRTRGTELAVLRRNLAAGVYGPTGSKQRVIAQLVVDERSQGDSRQAAGSEDRVARVESIAYRTAWLAVAALFLGALGLIVALARG